MGNNFLKNSMNFGALCGLALIIVSLLFYLLNINSNLLTSFVFFAVLIIFIIFGTKYYRDNYSNGLISYSRSLASGVLISLFMSIILSFFIYVFYKLLAPEEIERLIEMQEEQLYKRGLSDEQIEMSLQILKKFTTPLTLALGTIFTYTFWGTIFSLIISIFIKKSGQSYQQIMKEIEKDLNEENK
jgi:H+/Cl- antiporter ClcA